VISLPSLFVGVHTKSAALADLVGDLQSFLLGMGFQVRVDENFGPKTKGVVAQFQVFHRLKGDGVVGPRTWGVLLEAGFRPSAWQYDSGGVEHGEDPNWPPKPPFGAPNGLALFGKGFTYTPKPLPTMPGYVEADPKWISANIVRVDVPQLSPIKGSPFVLFNVNLVDQLKAMFFVWEQLQLLHYVKTWGGSFVTRYITGRTDKLSNHSFGSAIDLNVAWNGFKRQPALLNEVGTVRPLVLSAQELGFYWGGHYNDGMHFEAYKKLTKEQVEEIVKGLLEK